MNYPVTVRLSSAIERLFEDPLPAFGCLGLDAEEGFVEPQLRQVVEPVLRARALRDRLEKYVVNMADESEEMDCLASTETLRGHAIGLLIALRELQRHFPEL
jgi:hypothetical protein